jgi:FMN phosphatase YigB (HAD superfamily)
MDLVGYKPRYITLDCYGTLINFQMVKTVIPLTADRVAPENVATSSAAGDKYMLDQLDVRPEEILHVSPHLWYDIIPAHLRPPG